MVWLPASLLEWLSSLIQIGESLFRVDGHDLLVLELPDAVLFVELLFTTDQAFQVALRSVLELNVKADGPHVIHR